MQIDPVVFNVLKAYPWEWWGSVAALVAGFAGMSYVVKKQHLFDRLWGTLVLWCLMIPVLPGYLADIAWFGSALILLSWREYVRHATIRRKRLVWWVGVAALVSQWLPLLFFPPWTVWAVTLVLVTFTVMAVFRTPVVMESHRSSGVVWAVAGLLLIVVAPGIAVVSMQWAATDALPWYWIAVVMAQTSDACQMLVGKLCGKRSLHRWSPSKTWEGLVGGIVLAGLAVGIWTYVLGWIPLSWSLAMFLLGVGLTGFCGGLLSSYVKRRLNIKDWGRSLGGHGGVLDRIDSLVLTLPFVLWWTTF